MKTKRAQQSGFGRYLEKTVHADPAARRLFLGELKKAPLATRRRVLKHFPFLNERPR